jgi:voltage-gated potassium channel
MTDVIVCGYGIIGKRIAFALKKHNISYLAIDLHEPKIDETIPFLLGDATSEEVLMQANVDKAKTIVAATDNDVTNAFITLLARELNKNITILSCVSEIGNIEKLDKAGADYVFSMANVGRFIAKCAIEPFVAEFLDMINIMEGVEIMPLEITQNSKIANKTLKKAKIWKKTGANIIAIRRQKETIYAPSEDEKILPEDIILTIGNAEQLREIFNLNEPEKSIESNQ